MCLYIIRPFPMRILNMLKPCFNRPSGIIILRFFVELLQGAPGNNPHRSIYHVPRMGSRKKTDSDRWSATRHPQSLAPVKQKSPPQRHSRTPFKSPFSHFITSPISHARSGHHNSPSHLLFVPLCALSVLGGYPLARSITSPVRRARNAA